MHILTIGSGAREHALVRHFTRDPSVQRVSAAPGNPGIAEIADVFPVQVDDPAAVTHLARDIEADFVVIGPEAPLVAGAADALRAAGIACFGPSAAAAELEGSKSFAKEIMDAAGVPTARSRTCSNLSEVTQALGEFGTPYVVKHDGLAAGKGVLVTSDRDAALTHAAQSESVVVEEFLDGPEISLFAITDGEHAIPMLPAQDFKRAYDGDEGPNTGGMGAYTPLPWAPTQLTNVVMDSVVHPTVEAMQARGTPFSGLLYCGLCLTPAGIKVIEFNVRFGDPEIQPLLALLDTPLAPVLYAAATGALKDASELQWKQGSTVGVVLASRGYPASSSKGDVISGFQPREEGVFHAGTGRNAQGELVTAGGRVLTCVGAGADLHKARQRAYEKADAITFNGKQQRSDIALLAADVESGAA